MKNILVIAMLALLSACQMNSNSTSTKFKTIMIESVGKVETMPNEAAFYINLSCLDKSVATAKECLVKQSNDLMNKLLSYGIKKEDILTTSVDLQKSYKWMNNSQVFEGYRSSTTIHVKMRDLDKLDIVYTDLLENENLELGGLSYTHSEMDSLKNDAYVNALKKADVLADKLLTELPEKNKEVLKIGNVQITASVPAPQYKLANAAMMESSMDGGSIAISKGTIRVEATLYVEYSIK